MSCGIEHLSNCHGEVTMVTMLLTSVGLWLRMYAVRIRNYFFKKSNPNENDNDNHYGGAGESDRSSDG